MSTCPWRFRTSGGVIIRCETMEHEGTRHQRIWFEWDETEPEAFQDMTKTGKRK